MYVNVLNELHIKWKSPEAYQKPRQFLLILENPSLTRPVTVAVFSQFNSFKYKI